MTLQSQNLVMVGLGINGDLPPNIVQPVLKDGVHLRWAFKKDLGFPWYGFYLLRREHVKRQGTCMSSFTNNLEIGPLPNKQLHLPIGEVSSDINLVLNGEFPSPGADTSSVQFDLNDRKYLRFTFSRGMFASEVKVSIGFFQNTEVNVTVFSEEIPVAQSIVKGQTGELSFASIEFDKISAIEITGGQAALVELCFVSVDQDATVGWEEVPNFLFPMVLPVFHPDYPCTPGRSENFSMSRDLAMQRRHYVDPQQIVSNLRVQVAGEVSVENGSPIVLGTRTNWKDDLIGAVFQVTGDQTAYSIMTIVASDKLILSRSYNGASNNRADYTINRDTFGQIHDYLVHLVLGGPGAGSMADRFIPVPITNRGSISVVNGSADVMGNGTVWRPNLIGLTLQVNLDNASREGDNASYTIIRVDSATRLILDRKYRGPTLVSSPYRIVGSLRPREDRGGVAPSMPRHSPLDLILLAALNPEISQMLGLYWLDQEVDDNIAYDYLILADYVNLFLGKVESALDPEQLKRVIDTEFRGVYGYIVFNKKAEQSPPLHPPEEVRVYALPGLTMMMMDGKLRDAQNNAGILWNRSIAKAGVFLPNQAIMYHIWRSNFLGNEDTPADPHSYDYLITKEMPLLITDPPKDFNKEPERASNWPPFPLYYIDKGLQDGWYSYQVSGIDIFGRHSPNSKSGQWYQWTPVPDPRPWYYKNRPSDIELHPFAVRVLDKIPPPPPTGVEAYALDPNDPTVLMDQAYNNWRNSNHDIVGLRVRWQWTQAHILQAPDIREFRIYYQPGRMNSFNGTITNISAANTRECVIDTDISNIHPADAYRGAWLQIGGTAYKIVSSRGGNPLRLRVRRNFNPVHIDGTITATNGSPIIVGTGTNWDQKKLTNLTLQISRETEEYTITHVDSPEQLRLNRNYTGETSADKTYAIIDGLPRFINVTCTINVPSFITEGTIAITNGLNTIRGKGTNWDNEIIGSKLKISGESSEYTVQGLDPVTQQLRLDRNYEGLTSTEKKYHIIHPLFQDYSIPTNWRERCYVVNYDQNMTEAIDSARGAAGEELKGERASVYGAIVRLDGGPDLSVINTNSDSLLVPYIFLEKDRANPRRIYRIIEIDNVAKVLKLDNVPNTSGLTSRWIIGWPLRVYEIFIAAPDTNEGQSFVPSLNNPIAYASVGVTAADDKYHAQDDPQWARGSWGGPDRYGNESNIGIKASVFRVRRLHPDPPSLPPSDSERVFATSADYHGQSFFTFRWLPVAHLKTNIFRALDDSLLKTDWLIRTTRNTLNPENVQHSKFFPDDWTIQRKRNAANVLNSIASINDYDRLSGDSFIVLSYLPGNQAVPRNRLKDHDWIIRRSRHNLTSNDISFFPREWNRPNNQQDLLRRQNIASQLNSITSISSYSTLSNDGLRVLAGLPGNETAFTKLTLTPLDPDERDPNNPSLRRWRDLIGPDTNPQYVPQSTFRAYVDSLDGRSSNRYLYRAAYVDEVHNSSSLSLSSPPVYLPKVVPPSAPTITKIFAGDPDPNVEGSRKITLQWTSNLERDLAEYRIYRADDISSARDLRLMTLIHTIIVGNEEPENRPPTITWTDTPIRGLVTLYYRLVAVDEAGNISFPSDILNATAIDTRIPEPPMWSLPRWVVLNEINNSEEAWPTDGILGAGRRPSIRLVWKSDFQWATFIILRKTRDEQVWRTITSDRPYREIAPTQYLMYDTNVSPNINYSYRIRVISTTGISSIEFHDIEVARPPLIH
jgi:hypothetical protein